MSARILDGVPLADAIRAEVAQAVQRYVGTARKPGLAVVIVGENPASQVYVKAKGKACQEAGMHSETVRLPMVRLRRTITRSASVTAAAVPLSPVSPTRLPK